MRGRTAAAVSIFCVCYPRSHRLLPLAIPLSNGKRQRFKLSPLHWPSCERRVDFNFAHSFIGLHALRFFFSCDIITCDFRTPMEAITRRDKFR